MCVVVLCLLYRLRFVDGTWIDHDVVTISVQTLAIDPMMYSIDYRDKLYLAGACEKKERNRLAGRQFGGFHLTFSILCLILASS